MTKRIIDVRFIREDCLVKILEKATHLAKSGYKSIGMPAPCKCDENLWFLCMILEAKDPKKSDEK